MIWSNPALKLFFSAHILLILISNLLVQYPFILWKYHTTWGAFTYPFIFVLTDLCARLYGAHDARKVVILSMFPSFLISYIISSIIEVWSHGNWINFFTIHYGSLRISLACFIAYVIGQFSDILIFQRFRTSDNWWLAPTLSTNMSNLLDTLIFFAIAFYHSDNAFMNLHWLEIALVDACFKISLSLLACIPLYGLILHFFTKNTSIKFLKN